MTDGTAIVIAALGSLPATIAGIASVLAVTRARRDVNARSDRQDVKLEEIHKTVNGNTETLLSTNRVLAEKVQASEKGGE